VLNDRVELKKLQNKISIDFSKPRWRRKSSHARIKRTRRQIWNLQPSKSI